MWLLVGSFYTTNSLVLKYNRTSFALEPFHTIATNGGSHLKPFTINGTQYIMVANGVGGTSELFRYNSSRKAFVSIQVLPIASYAFDFMEIGGKACLFASSTATNGNSNILVWNPTTASFSVSQSFLTHSAAFSKFFTIGSDVFLAVANRVDHLGRTNINSKIFKWCGGQFVTV